MAARFAATKKQLPFLWRTRRRSACAVKGGHSVAVYRSEAETLDQKMQVNRRRLFEEGLMATESVRRAEQVGRCCEIRFRIWRYRDKAAANFNRLRRGLLLVGPRRRAIGVFSH
jgi:hypothetical protein